MCVLGDFKISKCTFFHMFKIKLFLILLFMSLSSLSDPLTELGEKYSRGIGSLTIENHNEFDGEMCRIISSEVIDNISRNYNNLTDSQKYNATLSSIFIKAELTRFSVDGWKDIVYRWESKEGAERIDRDVKYLLYDINNDGIEDHVLKVLDYNYQSDGYGWRVVSDFNIDGVVVSAIHRESFSKSMNYRDNNINIWPYGSKEGIARNFFYDFFVFDDHVYAVLIINREDNSKNIIVSDLDGDFRISKNYCHFVVSIENVNGKIN